MEEHVLVAESTNSTRIRPKFLLNRHPYRAPYYSKAKSERISDMDFSPKFFKNRRWLVRLPKTIAKNLCSQILLKIAPIEAHSMPKCGVQLGLDIFRDHRVIDNFCLVFAMHSILRVREWKNTFSSKNRQIRRELGLNFCRIGTPLEPLTILKRNPNVFRTWIFRQNSSKIVDG